MYWNNSWVSYFNKKNFLNKVLFFENIFYFLFSDSLFSFFFKTLRNRFSESNFFKKQIVKKKNKVKNFFFFKKANKKKKIKTKKTKYHFTRLWFIKFNNYILLSTFVYFYFKVKKKRKLKKNTPTLIIKTPFIFWKKKKGLNFKKKLFIPQVKRLF